MNVKLLTDLKTLLSAKLGDIFYPLKQEIDNNHIVGVTRGSGDSFCWYPSFEQWSAYEPVTKELLVEIADIVWGRKVVSKPSINNKEVMNESKSA